MNNFSPVSSAYAFEGFVLDPGRETLTGPSGAEISLRPKTFALLLHLAERPGRLQSRDELFAALWPGLIVTDDSLTQCVSELRRAFGASAERIIRTRPRRGYVFAADVRTESRETGVAIDFVTVEPEPSASTTANIAARRSAFVLIERPPTGPWAEAAAAMTQALGLELARYEDLSVRRGSTDAAMDFRLRCESVAADGVALVVLENAANEEILWTHRSSPGGGLSPDGSDFGMLANRVARQIAAASRRAAREKSRDRLSARELTLLASDHHQRGTEADTLLAYELLERALTLDPRYAQAHAWHAYTVQRGASHGWGPIRGDMALTRALDLARTAVSLSPYSPICLSRLAYCLMLHSHWDEALDTARLALTGPYAAGINVRVTCSEVLAQGGFAEEAIPIMETAIGLDPYCSPTVFSVLGRCLLMAGRAHDALPHIRLCAHRLPDYGPCHHSLLLAAHETGNSAEAGQAWRDIKRLQPGWTFSDTTGPWRYRNSADRLRMQAAVNACDNSATVRTN